MTELKPSTILDLKMRKKIRENMRRPLQHIRIILVLLRGGEKKNNTDRQRELNEEKISRN